MLTTILAQGGSLFDRRTLISAFLPAVVFWGAATAVLVGELVGWHAAVANWHALGGTAQGLALIAFFIWAGLWTFLTVAMRARITRFLEGYGPARGPGGAFRARLRRRYLVEVASLDRQDIELEQRQVVLVSAAESLRSLDSGAPGGGHPAGLDELDRLLDDLDGTGPSTGDDQIAQFAMRAQAWWGRLAAPAFPALTAEQRHRLDGSTRELAEDIQRRLQIVEAERAELLARLNAFPSDRARVMATMLGNVVRSAEGYGTDRYGMDAVLFWPRLQPLLSPAVVEAEEQARTVVDLLLTVAVSAMVFGVPIAFGIGLTASRPLAWWLPAVPLLVSIALRVLPAAIAAAGGLLVRIPALPDGWLAGHDSTRLQLLLTCLSVTLLLATVTYRAGVESAGTWGEQLKAALDLYRWNLLDAMNIRRPADAAAERRVWEELAGALHRGYEPDAALVRYITGADSTEDGPRQPCRVAVPARALPAFRPLGAADVEERWIWRRLPDEPYAVTVGELAGRFPLQPLPAGEPVPTRLLFDQAARDGGGALTAVGVAVAPADGLGGTLRSGDRIDLTLFGTDSQPLRTVANVTVLRWVPGTADAAAGPGGQDTLVVVVPQQLAADLLAMTRTATAVASWPVPLDGTGTPAPGVGQ